MTSDDSSPPKIAIPAWTQKPQAKEARDCFNALPRGDECCTILAHELLQLEGHELPHDSDKVKACLMPVPAGADEVELDSCDHGFRDSLFWSSNRAVRS